jgi:hypothetical protein
MRRTVAIAKVVVCTKKIEFKLQNPAEITISEKESLLNPSHLPLVFAAALTRTRGVLTRSQRAWHMEPRSMSLACITLT